MNHNRKGVKKYRESVFYYDWQYYDQQYYDWQTMTDNIMTDNTMTDNTIKEMPNTAYDRAIRNMKNKTTNILRGANRFRVLEDSDEECMNNKVQNVWFDNMRE